MQKIILSFEKKSYPITIASGLLNNPSSFLPLQKGDKAMIVTNQTLSLLYLDQIYQVLKKLEVKVDKIILPDGEQYKSIVMLNKIFTKLLKNLHGRNTILIALGGGVIGDLTGFTAASYQRGIRFIQIPTTLLSQVDSSIGGKTAINHPLGKNMIGAFHQPTSVIIDLDCLKTLPIREIASGIAEIIKYAIILDKEFFFWLEENMDALLHLDTKIVEYCIYHCCKLKASIVVKDEREIGLRSLLNLGHTYAHTIETRMGYGNWLHGEAVSVGIVMAARTSERLGQFTKKETQRIIALLKRVGLPVSGPREIPAKEYLPYIMRDKKILSDSNLRLVLPLKIGKSEIRNGVSCSVILDAISDCQTIL